MDIHTIILATLLFFTSLGFSQERKIDHILEEGQLLFRLEKGSWYGTDDMMARFATKKDSLGGYLSYETSEHKINTIFFGRFDPDRVLIRYTFDSVPKPEPIKIDTLNYAASSLEKSLIQIREDAMKRTYANEDKFFRFYENTAFNFIPLIQGKKKSVFILTASETGETLLIGNDYKLHYNRKNKFVKKERIHNSLLQFDFRSDDPEQRITETFHSHVITKYISSTDICTLLLYKDYLEWKQHIVMGKKEVSIFNLEREALLTLKRKAWDKIYGLQNKEK